MTSFHPNENRVVVANGDVITYDFLVVALGFQLRLVGIKTKKYRYRYPFIHPMAMLSFTMSGVRLVL